MRARCSFRRLLGVFAALSAGFTLPVHGQQRQAEEAAPAASAPASNEAGGAPGTEECDGLPAHDRLIAVLREIVAPGDPQANGGLGNHMWAAVVGRTGAICSIARSGDALGEQWLGSRGIAAEKAFTANAFSLPNFALSTANLFWPVQPGGSLYGLASSHPVRAGTLYDGPATSWGSTEDPLIGERIGGAIVFGGGLALYTPEGELVGAIGVSGDQSCTDHVIAWKMRHRLNLDNVPNGVSDDGHDNIIYDITTDPASGRKTSASGYGHPTCSPRAKSIAESFNKEFPTGAQE